MASRSASMRGRQSRRYGHDFERLLAAMDRKRWPDAVVKRADQGQRAYLPDFYVVSGGPAAARWLWRECCNAEHVDVAKKLRQAEEDIASLEETNWYPLVVWRKKRSHSIMATLRHETLLALTQTTTLQSGVQLADLWCLPVTVDYESLMGLVR